MKKSQFFLCVGFLFCSHLVYSQSPLVLEKTESLITLLATNDIHGGVEPMPLWSGIVSAIRDGLNAQFEKQASVLLLDAGDQFQGTLMGNYSEGSLVFNLMNEIGYTAAVLGNHDFDFGPKGWLKDRVSEDDKTDIKRLEVLESLSAQVRFPLLSANLYLKSSLKDTEGNPIEVSESGCRSKDPKKVIHWDQAMQPGFHADNFTGGEPPQKKMIKPYEILNTSGVKIALIGLDNPETSAMTTFDNVRHLCFRDARDAYYAIQDKLEKEESPDIFVLVIHGGNVDPSPGNDGDFTLSQMVKDILAGKGSPSGKPGKINAVIAGHTHQDNNELVGDTVPLIQSRSQGKYFGRIDLVWDSTKKALVSQKTRLFSSIEISANKCSENAKLFCKLSSDGQSVIYEGRKVEHNSKIKSLLEKAKNELSALAKRKMGISKETLEIDRIKESALANFMTDAVLKVSQQKNKNVDIALLNSSGLRQPLFATGDGVGGTYKELVYEDLFRVLPISNEGVLLYPVTTEKLYQLLQISVMTCGKYGALMQSGLKVTYERDPVCQRKTTMEEFKKLPSWIQTHFKKNEMFDPLREQMDFQARVVTIEKDNGPGAPAEYLFRDGRIEPGQEKREFIVSTFDFLADGGGGYEEFKDIPKIEKLETTLPSGEQTHVLREVLSEFFAKSQPEFSSKIDGRWKNTLKKPAPTATDPETTTTVTPKLPVSPEPNDPEPR